MAERWGDSLTSSLSAALDATAAIAKATPRRFTARVSTPEATDYLAAWSTLRKTIEDLFRLRALGDSFLMRVLTAEATTEEWRAMTNAISYAQITMPNVLLRAAQTCENATPELVIDVDPEPPGRGDGGQGQLPASRDGGAHQDGARPGDASA